MSNFEAAIKVVLEHEGGLSDSKADPGGLTKYGITKRQYPDVNIRDLTIAQATTIYKNDYWRPCYEAVPQKIATKWFDTAVNAGNRRADILMQKALVACGIGVVVDGFIGEKTMAAIAKCDPDKLLQEYRKQQVNFYLDLIDRKPSLSVFRTGWLRRAES